MSKSVVTSCRNEASNIPHIFDEIAQLDKLIPLKKIVIVDNGSTDETATIIERYCNDKRVIIVTNPVGSSYSQGYLAGLEQTRGDQVMTFHSDLQYSPYNFLEKIWNHQDFHNTEAVFFGHRTDRDLVSRIFSIGLMAAASLSLSLRFADYNSQPKIFFNDLNKL